HSERMVDQLASRALTRGTERRRIHVHPDRGAAGADRGDDGEEISEEQQDVDRVTSVVVNFASPRDAADIAALTRCRVIRPQSLVWLEGYQALLRWRTENGITGLHAVPYDVETAVGTTKAFPLGRWVHQQRKSLRAGELDPHRKTLLDMPEAGMVWEPGDEAWETKLAVLRTYHRAHGHLAPRQDALWGEGAADREQLAVGQLLANLRRKDGLGKDPQRATERAAQLTEIDPDWNCPWPLDWQRHYRVLADLVDADGSLPDISPGVLMDGDDIGRWLQRQTQPGTWKQLSEEQQRRLTGVGVQPDQAPAPAPAASRGARGPSKAQQAFQRGLTALAQWVEREGPDRPVPRKAVEVLPDGTETKLGVWVSNTRARRDKLSAEQLDALRKMSVEWA
ncbi:helicase, partial [Streptomyces sp. SID6041]|nr:helicase [Streptomyces sp. SID6041]